MIRIILLSIASLLLSACSGILVYDDNKEVYQGNLDENNANEMKSSGMLVDGSNYDRVVYGLNSDGSFAGVCLDRTHTKNQDQSTKEKAISDFHVFNSARVKTISMNKLDLAKAIDGYAGNSAFESYMTYDEIAYETRSGKDVYKRDMNSFNCNEVGASVNGNNLVLHVQPFLITDSTPQDLYIEIDVKGKQAKILDIEYVKRTESPQRVIPKKNPGANRVRIINGVINIDNKPVLLNGNSIQADGVSHYLR